ncbi:amidohydrolase [Alteromonadaceae bacterium M269]|nr:amidohydrolase [Alteromonadaceae bacterium M269]
MQLRFLLLSILIGTQLSLSLAFAQKVTVYKGATLLDASREKPIENAVLVISEGRIQAVGPAKEIPIPQNASIVDVKGRWIIPGLVDSHMHFSQSGSLYTRPDGLDLRTVRSYESDRAHSDTELTNTFRRYLASGVTAVVDAGGPASNISIREKASQTNGLAPRIALAGPLLATLTPAFAERVERLDLGNDPTIIPVTTPQPSRELVKEQLALKPDIIKVWYIASPGRPATQSYDTVAAIIDEAHKNGVRVAVHATELETARLAVKAGADILVHTVDDKPVDDNFVAALKEKDVIVMTTAVVYEHIGQLRSRQVELTPIEKTLGDPFVISTWEETSPENKSPAIAEAINARVETILSNLKTLADAGVRVAVGTDAGNPGTLHGPSIHRELALLEGAGFTPKQILKAATKDAAGVFSESVDFGTLETGNKADFLVLNADPMLSVNAYQAIDTVVLNGHARSPETLAPFSPAALVQKQLDAYNAHDIDAFAATYSEDVELFNLPQVEPSSTGRKALRSSYGSFFKEVKPHCRALSRIVEGNFVIDQEFCQFGEGRLRATAVYQVEDGLIRRVWFASRR